LSRLGSGFALFSELALVQLFSPYYENPRTLSNTSSRALDKRPPVIAFESGLGLRRPVARGVMLAMSSSQDGVSPAKTYPVTASAPQLLLNEINILNAAHGKRRLATIYARASRLCLSLISCWPETPTTAGTVCRDPDDGLLDLMGGLSRTNDCIAGTNYVLNVTATQRQRDRAQSTR
jgi:hypothetical protein